jgi:hypothetical protein
MCFQWMEFLMLHGNPIYSTNLNTSVMLKQVKFDLCWTLSDRKIPLLISGHCSSSLLLIISFRRSQIYISVNALWLSSAYQMLQQRKSILLFHSTFSYFYCKIEKSYRRTYLFSIFSISNADAVRLFYLLSSHSLVILKGSNIYLSINYLILQLSCIWDDLCQQFNMYWSVGFCLIAGK